MQTALYGIITEDRETGGECLIWANTQNIPFNCSNTTQDKAKACKVPVDEG